MAYQGIMSLRSSKTLLFGLKYEYERPKTVTPLISWHARSRMNANGCSVAHAEH